MTNGVAVNGAPSTSAAPVSVLLVEDDAMVRGWVRLCLRDTEFRLAAEATSAAEAIALAERRRVDLFLVDYRCPIGWGPSSCASCVGAGWSLPLY